MSHPSDCDRIRPLLFCVIEDTASDVERAYVEQHLVSCAACRAEEAAERELTGWLQEPVADGAPSLEATRPGRSLLFGVVAAAAVVLVAVSLLVFTTDEVVYGSISHGNLASMLGTPGTGGETVPLGPSTHVRTTLSDTRVIRIRGVAEIRLAGPAVIELDHVDGRWKLVLLEGQVSLTVESDASMIVASKHGRRAVGVGDHFFDLSIQRFRQALEPQDSATPAELIAKGHQHFYAGGPLNIGGGEYAEAEACFRSALEHPKLTDKHRNEALFWLAASLGSLKRYEDALATQRKWLKRYPKDDHRSYVLYFHGEYHKRLGRKAEAEKCWRMILEEDPGGSMAVHARRDLGLSLKRTPAVREPAKSGVAKPKEQDGGEALKTHLPKLRRTKGGYVVVAVDLDARRDRAWLDVARTASRHHDAKLVNARAATLGDAAKALKQLEPKYVLFVLKPETLDNALQRRILLMSTLLDDDPLPDFAWGYLTARDVKGLGALWKRIAGVHEKGLASRRWMRTAVASSIESTVHPGSLPGTVRAAGFRGDQIYFGIVEKDADVLEDVDRLLPTLEGAAVIQMTGNGDPQGIWLFDDHRNIDRSRHWEYGREKVGHDPKGEMPRIMASKFGALKLSSPVIWSGTCHSASVDRVFVEGDIVSTFGRTGDRATVHRLDPERSLALQLVEAGAAALLAPIGANHGMSVSMETDFALRHGASLGETIKSTWDDVCLAAGRRLRLDVPEEGKPASFREPIMQGGGANRILIGDPSVAPFDATESPMESVKIERTERGFTVTVKRKKGFHPRAWDIFGTDRGADWRIPVRVDLAKLIPNDRPAAVTAAVEVVGEDKKPLPYRMTRCVAEAWHGTRYLHLQANAPRKGIERVGLTAVFTVRID